MCGTHHPVGTAVCSTCRASGVTQLRLMFECPTCGHLGLNPQCEMCPATGELPYSVVEDEELIVAEEIDEDPYMVETSDEETEDDLDLDIDLEDEEAYE